MRIEKVLVPVDFSPASRLALNYGIALTRRFRAELTLLHVLETLEKKHVEEATRKLSALVAPEDQDDLDVAIVVRSGNIKSEILSAVQEEKADLVVIGVHGRGFISRLLIGSVAIGLLRKLEVPVVTVSHATRPVSFDRILFATDLSEASTSAQDFVLDLARLANSKVTFLHAVETGAITAGESAIGAYIAPDYVEEARAKLDQLTIEALQRNARVESALIEGVPAEAILKVAEETCAEVIVMAAKHKGALERALLGSTAERVVREARVPVLSIPASTQAKIEEAAQPPAA